MLRDKHGIPAETSSDRYDIWFDHCATLECAIATDPQTLVLDVDATQRARPLFTDIEPTHCILRLDVEEAIAGVRVGKWWKFDTAATARILHPLALKTSCLVSEPVQAKGGRLWDLFKGSGAHDLVTSHRGI